MGKSIGRPIDENNEVLVLWLYEALEHAIMDEMAKRIEKCMDV
jgi:hypothetical protein